MSEIVEITQLLERWRDGNQAARDQIIAKLYPDIRARAQSRLGLLAPGELSLSATDLAHEAYLRLSNQHNLGHNRGHFLALVADVIKRVVLDLLKAKKAQKCLGANARISLHELGPEALPETEAQHDAEQLLQSLEVLEKRDALAAKIVELRFFVGLSNSDAAEALHISCATANRHFAFARAWLLRQQ